MKKALIISGTVYSIACLGLLVWGAMNPEAYGKWCGKMMTAMFKVFEEKGEN